MNVLPIVTFTCFVPAEMPCKVLLRVVPLNWYENSRQRKVVMEQLTIINQYKRLTSLAKLIGVTPIAQGLTEYTFGSNDNGRN